METKFLIFLIFYCISVVNCQQCYVQGVIGGVILDSHTTSSYNECLEICKADTECSCFTYYQSVGDCIEYSLFSSLDNSCATCLSGEPVCDEENLCEIDGLCNGVPINSTITDSEEDCLAWCQEVPECEFYAYQGNDGNCALLESCSEIQPCSNCHSGQRTCSVSAQGRH